MFRLSNDKDQRKISISRSLSRGAKSLTLVTCGTSTLIIAEWDDHGGIPEQIFKLHKLQHLDLSYTAIRAVPQKIVQLRRLQTLNLNHCMLLESLSGELGKLPLTCKLVQFFNVKCFRVLLYPLHYKIMYMDTWC